MDEANIFVYSIHTESVFTFPQFRGDQYTAILEDVGPEADVKEQEEVYGQAGAAGSIEYGLLTETEYLMG